jgi:subtilisin family serine protease
MVTELRRRDGKAIASTDAGSGLPTLSAAVLQPAGAEYAGLDGALVQPGDCLAGRLPDGGAFGGPPVAYGRAWASADGSGAWLQYWLFSVHNPHHLVGTHQGDWEMVQLKVDPSCEPADGGLLAATCFQHGEPEGRRRDELTGLIGEDGLLTLRVALGSHASYFDEEHLHLGDSIRPAADAEACAVLPLDEGAGWVQWPGYWGGSRVMGHPRSPRGPRTCRPEWADPEAQHAAGLYMRARRLGKPVPPVAVTTSVQPAEHEAVLIAQAGREAPVEHFERQVKGLGLWSAVENLHAVPAPAGAARQLVVRAMLREGENAFDLARTISARTGWEVEPDLDSTVFRPSADAYGVCEEIGASTKDRRWAIEKIGCAGAWEVSTGAGVKVGHPDTGYVDHPELAGGTILAGGYDLLKGDRDPHDVLEGLPPAYFPGHGTGTASVIASRAVADSDFAGAAPDASILPLRVARTVVLLRGSRVVQAIRLARAEDCRVISISLGGVIPGSSLRREIEAAVAEGRIVLAAAGQPLPFVVEPASYEATVAIAGSTIEDERWKWSGRGASVDFCAPAVAVPRAVAKTGGVDRGDGTSFATALSAGVAALWFAKHRDELLAGAPEEIQPKFLSLVALSARPLAKGDEGDWGAGIVDAAALMRLPLSEAKPVERRPEPSRGKRIISWLSRLVEAPVEGLLAAALPDEPEQAAERFGAELASLASEDEGVRVALREAALQAPVPGEVSAAAPTAPARLAERASPSLRQALDQPA